MLKIQMKVPREFHAKFSSLTIPIDRYPQGYEAGFAQGHSEGYLHGKKDAQTEHESESSFLLASINTALKSAGGRYIQKDAQTLADVPEKVPYVYDNGFEQGFIKGLRDGKAEERDCFWESMQVGGTRVDYNCAFRFWQDEVFHPKYKVVPSGQNAAYSLFQHMTNLKKAEAAYIDLSNLTDTSSTYSARTLFAACPSLEEVEDIGLHGDIYYYATFYKCPNLHTVAKIRTKESTKWNIPFSECASLVNITFEGRIGQNGLSLADSPKLSRASIESVIGALSDTANGKSITLSKAAVSAAYGSTESVRWATLIGTKPNWTISLV